MPLSKPLPPSGTTPQGSADVSQGAQIPASKRRRLATEDTPATAGNTSNESQDLRGRKRRMVIYKGLSSKFPKQIVQKCIKLVEEEHCSGGSCSCGIWYRCYTCGDKHCSLTKDTHFLICDDCSLPFCKSIWCGYFKDNVRGDKYNYCLKCWDVDLEEPMDPQWQANFWHAFWINGQIID